MTALIPSDRPEGAAETIELFGVRIGHAMSWPPVAGRALATLMLHKGPMTVDELCESLQASAGTLSEALRLLIIGGVVRRIKTPGQRKKSYVYRDDAWLACMRHTVESTMELLEMAEAANKSAEEYPPEIRRRFAEMRDYYVFISAAFKSIEQQLQETKTKNS